MKKIRILIFLLLIIAILFLNKHYGWSVYLSNKESIINIFDSIDDNLFMASVIYIIITAVGCVVLALPGVTFAILAGMLFEPIFGVLLCSLATTLGAALAFLVGRYFLKDAVKPIAERNKYIKKLLFSNNEKNEFVVLMITRLVPLFPFNLQNFAYGITDIDFWKYSLYSFIFMLPGTASFTLGSAGFADAENRNLYLLLSVILAVMTFFAGNFVKKKHSKSIED